MTPPRSDNSSSVVLGGVTIVDTRTGALAVNQDVAIIDGQIATITAARPGIAGRIDLTGSFLVPGFIDMHAHALNSKRPAGALALMLAHGITGFRQMSGTQKLLTQRKAGTLELPEASPALLALTGDLLTPVNAGTPEAAVAAVSAGAAEGADFIKIAAVSPAAFTAAQGEARRLGIRIGGHLPAALDPLVASKAGLWSIEHLGPGIPMLAATSTLGATLRRELAGARELKLPAVKLPFMGRVIGVILKKLVVNPMRRTTPAGAAQLQRAIDTFSEDAARTVARAFVENGTWNVPTLIRQLTTQKADLPRFRTDSNLRYVSESATKVWNGATDTFDKFPEAMRQTFHREYDLQRRLLKIFDEEGVQLATGTDSTGAGWVIPGVALHQEFDELASAGLAPLRVLQMATLNGADMLGTTTTMGTVEVGKVADLVLLDADPTASVDNLHTVSGVVRAGRYYASSELEALKNDVATARSIHE